MLHETWTDQYERLQRSRELLKQIGEPTSLPQDVLPARDVLYHFCCDAFHLRDWIAATLGTGKTSKKAIARQLDKEVIFPSPELSACCDVANGSKHLRLHRPSYVTRTAQGHAEVVSQSVNIGVPPMTVHSTGGGYVQDTFTIDIKGQQHDAQDVATKAVAAWDQWINGPSTLAAQLR